MFSHNPIVATFQAAKIAEDSWGDINNELIDEERLRDSIETIGSIDPEQVHIEETVLEDTDNALINLETGNYIQIADYFERVGQSADKIIEDTHTEDLNELEPGDKIGEGLNDAVYELEEDQVLVVTDREINSLEEAGGRKTRFEQVPEEVNIPRIDRAGIYNAREAFVEDHAPGEPLHEWHESYDEWSRRVEKLSEAPQNHYDKLLEDTKILEQYGLSVDDSKADNIFYDDEEGFTIVDVNDGGEPDLEGPLASYVTLATSITYPRRNDWSVSEDDLDNLCSIHHKLRSAGDPYSDNFDRDMALKIYPCADIAEEHKPPKPEKDTVDYTVGYKQNID